MVVHVEKTEVVIIVLDFNKKNRKLADHFKANGIYLKII